SCTAVAVAEASRELSQVFTATRNASGTASHAASCSRRLLRMALLEEITQSAQREDAGVAGLELLAQARDVDLDRVWSSAVLHGEEAVGNRLLAHGLSLLEHQRLEHRALARRQPERPVGERGQPGIGVVAQRAA